MQVELWTVDGQGSARVRDERADRWGPGPDLLAGREPAAERHALRRDDRADPRARDRPVRGRRVQGQGVRRPRRRRRTRRRRRLPRRCRRGPHRLPHRGAVRDGVLRRRAAHREGVGDLSRRRAHRRLLVAGPAAGVADRTGRRPSGAGPARVLPRGRKLLDRSRAGSRDDRDGVCSGRRRPGPRALRSSGLHAGGGVRRSRRRHGAGRRRRLPRRLGPGRQHGGMPVRAADRGGVVRRGQGLGHGASRRLGRAGRRLHGRPGGRVVRRSRRWPGAVRRVRGLGRSLRGRGGPPAGRDDADRDARRLRPRGRRHLPRRAAEHLGGGGSDRDDDGVPDASDVCPDVEGPSRATDSGCPVVHRRLDTSYADGVLSGSVVLVDPEASPAGACSARSFVEVYSVEGTMWKDGLWSGWTDPDGTFAAPVGRLAHGTAYYVWADPYLDPSAGICQTADEQVFLDRDGDSFGDSATCPIAGRPGRPGFSGRSGAAGGRRRCRVRRRAVSGRLRVADPEHAPAGACAARRPRGSAGRGELEAGSVVADRGGRDSRWTCRSAAVRVAGFPQVVVDARGERSEVVEIRTATRGRLRRVPGVRRSEGGPERDVEVRRHRCGVRPGAAMNPVAPGTCLQATVRGAPDRRRRGAHDDRVEDYGA